MEKIFRNSRSCIKFSYVSVESEDICSIQKIILKDDHFIRDPGSVVPHEFPFYYLIYRNLSNYRFTILEVSIHIFLVSNILFPLDRGEGKVYPVGDLPSYTTSMMRLLQWDYYLKKRDNSFDFLMLGEKEFVPME